MTIEIQAPLETLFSTFLTESDLDGQMKVNEKNRSFLQVFNTSFQEFVGNHPDVLPIGDRERRIQLLQKQLADLKQSKDSFLKDVERQVVFFKDSKAELEDVYSVKTDELLNQRQSEREQLTEALEAAQLAARYVDELIPFQAFLNKVDSLVDQESHDEASCVSRQVRPSSRAMLLSSETSGSEIRAYKIEHALLKARLSMLRKQVDMMQKTELARAAVEKIMNK